MDCEKFDQIVIDAVYDELDELTLAAAKRHADGCPRCQAAWSGLRATRRIGILPLVEAPAGLEPSIMQAAREAHRNLPWTKRFGRAISWAGSYAMRPQTAMAALLLLMLGSSIIFVRAKPNRSSAGSRVSVTERGIPEQAQEELHPEKSRAFDDRAPTRRLSKRDEERGGTPGPAFAAPPATAAREQNGVEGDGQFARGSDKAESPADVAPRPKSAAAPSPAEDFTKGQGNRASASADKKRADTQLGAPGAGAGDPPDSYQAAMDLFNAGRYAQAEKAFDAIAATSSKNAASAAFYSAKSAELDVGCGKAAPKFDAAAQRYWGSTPGADALLAAANCYKQIANYDAAKIRYHQLRNVAGYRDKAEGELANLQILEQQQVAQRSRSATAKQAPAKAAAPAAPARKPAATQELK